jgi:hypothetical protein
MPARGIPKSLPNSTGEIYGRMHGGWDAEFVRSTKAQSTESVLFSPMSGRALAVESVVEVIGEKRGISR